MYTTDLDARTRGWHLCSAGHPRFIHTPLTGLMSALPSSNVSYLPGCDTLQCGSIDPSAISLAAEADVSLVSGLHIALLHSLLQRQSVVA